MLSLPEGLFAGRPTDSSQDVASIIKKIIEGYGGKEHIDAMHSLHAKGEIETFMPRDRGTYEYYLKQGRKLRVETRYKRSSELRILNGNKGYRSNNNLPFEEVHGPRYFAMVYQYKHLDILRDLMNGAYQIRYEGGSSLGGRDVDILRLNDREGTFMDIYVGKSNSLILKVTGYFIERNQEMNLSSEFSDFRKVGGLLMPFRITNYAQGLKIGETVIHRYNLNPTISDSFFEPANLQSL